MTAPELERLRRKAVKLAVRALAVLFLLALVAHWLDAPWLSKLAATGMALVFILAALASVWWGWDEGPEPVNLPTWTVVQPSPWEPLEPPPRAEPEPRTYRLDRTPRSYQDPEP